MKHDRLVTRGKGVLLLVVGAALTLAGSAFGKDKPITSLADVAGKWEGSVLTQKGEAIDVSMTLGEDGTYQALGWMDARDGKGTLKDGKLQLVGKKGRGVGTLNEDGELTIVVTGSTAVTFGKFRRSEAGGSSAPIASLADVAGKWEGQTITQQGEMENVTLTLREDGTYDASTWRAVGGGKATLKNGKLQFAGKQGGGTGTLSKEGDLAIVVRGASTINFAKLKKNTAAVAGKAINSVADVAGKWEGSAIRQDGEIVSVTLVVRENGSYEATTWQGVGSGKATVKDGKLHLTAGAGVATGALAPTGELVVFVNSGGVIQSAKLTRK